VRPGSKAGHQTVDFKRKFFISDARKQSVCGRHSPLISWAKV